MNIVTDVILPLALAFIMFVLGLGLTGSDFLRVIKKPLQNLPLEDFISRILEFQTPLTSSGDRFSRKIPGKKRKFRRAARGDTDRRREKTGGKAA